MTVGGVTVGSAAVGSTGNAVTPVAVPTRILQADRPPGTVSPGVGGVGATTAGGAVVASGRGGDEDATISVVRTQSGVFTAPARTLQIPRDTPTTTGVGAVGVTATNRRLNTSRDTPTVVPVGVVSVGASTRTLQLQRDTPTFSAVVVTATAPNRSLRTTRPPDTSDPGVSGVGAAPVGSLGVGSATDTDVSPTITLVRLGDQIADMPLRSVQVTRDAPTFSPLVAPVTTPSRTLRLARNAPDLTGSGTAAVSPDTRVIELTRPGFTAGFPNWVISGTALTTVPDERVTDKTLTLSARVQSATLSGLRVLKSDEGKVSILDRDTGGFVAVDRADGANTFKVLAPVNRTPLRQSGDYHVQKYEENLVSQSVNEWDVEIEFAKTENRTDSPSISESRATDEWAFDTRLGQLTTDRVDAEFVGRGSDGVKRFEIIARLDFDQSHVFEAALSRLGGVRVRDIPDATNEAVDETGGDATINVTSPVSDTIVPDGDYVVTEWESERLTDAYQEIEFTIAET